MKSLPYPDMQTEQQLLTPISTASESNFVPRPDEVWRSVAVDWAKNTAVSVIVGATMTNTRYRKALPTFGLPVYIAHGRVRLTRLTGLSSADHSSSQRVLDPCHH